MEGAVNNLKLWMHSVPCWEASPPLELTAHNGQQGSAGKEREERAGLLGVTPPGRTQPHQEVAARGSSLHKLPWPAFICQPAHLEKLSLLQWVGL